jgi:hypothetical protein
MSWRAAALTSLLVTLSNPATWVVGLAGFLVRGGLVLFIVPIVILPTPVGLANVIAPTLTAFVFGGVSPSFIALVAALSAVILLWLVGGGRLAAGTEEALIAAVAADEDIAAGFGREPGAGGRAWRILVARLIAYTPLAAALAWGAARVVEVTYRELTAPSDAVTPVGLRVLREVPDAVALIVGTWVVGEIVGALAARLIVLDRASIPGALVRATGLLVRRPLTTLATFLVPSLVTAAVAIPAALAAGVAWDGLRVALVDSGPGNDAIVRGALVLFILVWLGGLAATAVAVTWRHAAWTVEVLRGLGTFGASGPARSGGWNGTDPSGTL